MPPGTAGALGLFYSLISPTDLGSCCLLVSPFLNFFSLPSEMGQNCNGGGGGNAACGARACDGVFVLTSRHRVCVSNNTLMCQPRGTGKGAWCDRAHFSPKSPGGASPCPFSPYIQGCNRIFLPKHPGLVKPLLWPYLGGLSGSTWAVMLQ